MTCSCGAVSANGAKVKNGSNDWEATRLNTGRYHIVFKEKSEIPSVVVSNDETQGSAVSNSYKLTVCNENRSGFQVIATRLNGNGSSALADTAFSFMAIRQMR